MYQLALFMHTICRRSWCFRRRHGVKLFSTRARRCCLSPVASAPRRFRIGRRHRRNTQPPRSPLADIGRQRHESQQSVEIATSRHRQPSARRRRPPPPKTRTSPRQALTSHMEPPPTAPLRHARPRLRHCNEYILPHQQLRPTRRSTSVRSHSLHRPLSRPPTITTTITHRLPSRSTLIICTTSCTIVEIKSAQI